MDDYGDKRKINPIALLAIVAELVLAVIVVFSIVNLLNGDKDLSGVLSHNVKISNYAQEIANVGEDGLKGIRFSIYDIVWLNNENLDDKHTINATIRSDSVRKERFKKDGVYQIYFVVDLPDLQQSFQVNYVYSTRKGYNEKVKVDYSTMAYCPDESQKIYSGQTCRDRYAGQAEAIIENFDFE